MLQGIGLSKNFQGKYVIRDVDITVRRGEIIGLIGPNGSGKTTLVRLLSGEETPDSGQVVLEGKPLVAFAAKERAQRVAVLPQEGLSPVAFTVQEVVAMGRYPHESAWSWLERRMDSMVETVLTKTGLTEDRHRPVQHLSGGQRQRVAIAKAMAQEPHCFILDEPTTYMDIAHQIAVLDEIKEWQRERELAVLVVFHDLNLAAHYCDRILAMKDGRIVREGPPDSLLTASLIREVYDVDAAVIRHPVTGVPQVLLSPGETTVSLLSRSRTIG
ncbi:ABC transporter ATP-binding protein [Marinithermofilum abyssi]|uniref:ABC transporter ATP-binding protein n=1 Tax=Marinithermofilum abyssi TaxID=1571185 RepID=A0A8J2YCL9_9BACL|nr:ABC transporter ATP-binding protein [Marinithermofilum abyssi]GGE09561.1 ABC transporter ATP-binding protein [Marinithermofilum abyssi]